MMPMMMKKKKMAMMDEKEMKKDMPPAPMKSKMKFATITEAIAGKKKVGVLKKKKGFPY